MKLKLSRHVPSADAVRNGQQGALALDVIALMDALKEAKCDDLEKRLAEFPVIAVPTITLEGDANGAPHPDPEAYAGKFSGKYAHRLVTGGVGHNLPQEAPKAFAGAVIEVARP